MSRFQIFSPPSIRQIFRLQTREGPEVWFVAYHHSIRANEAGINVSHKTLNITISIIDLDGHPVSVSDPIPTAPGVEASNDFGTLTNPIDAYCKFEAFPAGDRNDLRVVLVAGLVRTFDEGNQTNIPTFVARTVAGY